MERTTADDFGVQSVTALADKYLARYSSQLAFSRGKYPPSRDTDFRIQVEQDQFHDELAKGGHGVPISSASRRLPDGASGPHRRLTGRCPRLCRLCQRSVLPRDYHRHPAADLQGALRVLGSSVSLSPLIVPSPAQVIPDSGSSNLWGVFAVSLKTI